MRRIQSTLALLLLAALAATAIPRPVLANGAASTRNILLGIGVGTYLIIRHNKAVHQHNAQVAAQQAAAAQQANNAWAAYNAAERSAKEEALVNVELRKEVSYQQALVAQQQRELAAVHLSPQFTRVVATTTSGPGPQKMVASTGIGWGSL